MSTPISFTVRPPSAPFRPSPLGNGGARRAGPPSRRLFEEGHDDQDEEGYGRRSSGRSREERVDGFRNGRSHGSVDSLARNLWRLRRANIETREEKPGPLVIPALPNRDWRQTVQRRTPSYRPEVKLENGDAGTHERSGDQPQRSGIRQGVTVEGTESRMNGHSESPNGFASNLPNGHTNGETTANNPEVMTEPMTLEQRALAEILAGDQRTESAEERAKRELVIAMEEGKGMTEEDAFKRDINYMPEEVRSSNPSIGAQPLMWTTSQSSLEDYEAIPVSAFGLAMVRGMGYDPSSSSNTIIHEPKLRPQLLGLGATPMDPSIRPTHSRHISHKERQAERQRKTGRGFNASNLMLKKEKDGDGTSTPGGSSRLTSPDGSEASRRRRRDYDDEESDRDVKRERNDDQYGSERSRRDEERDGRRSKEYETEEERARRKARQREREYETDEERARRKAKERARDKERNGSDDRDRDRYRDRDRESNGERDRRRDRNGDDRR